MSRQLTIIVSLLILTALSGARLRSIVNPVMADGACPITDSVCFNDDLIIALEFVCDSTSVQAIFEECSDEKVDAVRSHTWFDFVFILFYSAFFITWGIYAIPKGEFWRDLVIAGTIVAGVADIVENIHIFFILECLGDGTALNKITGTMEPIVWLKWLVVFAVFAVLTVRGLRNLWSEHAEDGD